MVGFRGTAMNDYGIETGDTNENYGGHFRTFPSETSPFSASQNAPTAMQGNGSYSVIGVYRYEGATYSHRTGGIWSTGASSNSDNTMIEFNQTDGRLQLDWGATSKPHYQYLSNFTFPNFGTWYFIAVTVQAQTGGCGTNCVPSASIWVGGAVTPGILTDVNAGVPYMNTPGANATTQTPNVAPGPLVIGLNAHGEATSMTTATTLIYNRALSAGEVQQMYVSMQAKMAERGVVLETAPPNQAPAIVTQPVSLAVTAGQTATFLVTASGTQPLSYQWMKNGVAIPGATNLSYTTPATTLSDSGSQFTVVINNVTNTPVTSSPPAVLTVNTMPTVAIPTISPNGGTFTATVSVTLTCATANAQIYYTTDGSAPDQSSLLYQGPFHLSANATVRVKGFLLGANPSAEPAPAIFVINQPATLPPGTPVTVPSAFAPKAYPNPWRSDKHAAHPSITFAGLTAGTTIKIFTTSGHKVRTLSPEPGAPSTASWDLTNDKGENVASGIYLYVITDTAGDKVRGKVAVIK
jgi:hypothetical protein